MRREDRDELIRTFLTINAMLRGEVKALRRAVEVRRSEPETKYNPNWAKQPRAPRGVSDGGQWVDSGGRGGGPKQADAVRPAQAPESSPNQRNWISLQNLENLSAANDNDLARIPLGATRLAPFTLPLMLYGDTPRPRTEARLLADDLVLLITESHGQREATFHRVVTPERRVPIVVLGVDTGLTTTTPAQLEHLYVYATVEGDVVRFSRAELELAYGQTVPGISASEHPPSSFPGIVPITEEERRLQFNLRRLGATQDQVDVALQQLRHQESEGEAFLAELRRLGASRSRIDHVLWQLRLARGSRPYRPPTSGPLLEVFPGLATARGSTMIYPDAEALTNIGANARRSERAARTAANALIAEIRALEPNYIPPNLNDPSTFPTTAEGRQAFVDRLRQERAATYFRTVGDLQPLQVETFRFVQARVDAAYDEGARLYDRGEIRSQFHDREHAIGNHIDRVLDEELRSFFESLGISIDGELVRVRHGENISRWVYRVPDARVGDIYFDFSVAEKSLETARSRITSIRQLGPDTCSLFDHGNAEGLI